MMIRAATFRRALWTWTIGGLLACSGKEDDSTGKDPNAERDQKSKECISDAECSDGLFCNGAELCLPEDEDADDFGCIKARKRPSCDDGVECTQDSCSDSLGRCLYEAPDEDGDGHGSSDCEDEDGAPLGDDCDDEDAKRFPGNFEVCDAKGHDEDCDLSTFGERDRDGDGEWDAECCNGSSKQKTCGTDCNDLNISQRSKQPEFCDDLDNDCDGEVDNDAEPVAWYPDDDLDLFGRDVDKPKMSCTPIVGSSVLATDCIDGDPSRHPAAAEVCDDVDNDCDGLIDEPAFCMTGGGIEVDPDAPNGVGGSGSSAGGSGGQSSSDGGSEGAGGSGGAVSTGGSADTGGGSGTGGEGQAGDCIDQLMGRYLLRSDDGVALYYDNTDQKAVREATTNDPIEDFVEVSDGEGFGCGLLESGEVLCWSTLSTGNRYGELGWGDELTGSAVATPPLGAKPVVFEDGTPLTNFKHVARYGDWRYATSACAISADDELYCWGDIPTFNDVAQPMGYAIPVLEEDGSAFDAIEQVAVGDDWACAVRGENSVGDPENQVWCVGNHASSGRLGNGSPSVHSPFPTPVAGSQGATQVALVDSTACALIDGNVKCWGSDVHGLLGNGPDSTGAAYGAEVSVRVDGSDEVFEQVIAIQGGDTAFCAVTQANEVGCWGYHTAAQQVTGEAAVHRTPQDFLALGALFQVNAYLNIYYLSTDGQFHGESGTVIDPWCSALD